MSGQLSSDQDAKARLADTILLALRDRSCISLTSGEAAASRRLWRAARHAWKRLPQEGHLPFFDFTEDRLMVIDTGYQLHGQPQHCVIFRTFPTDSELFDAPLYGDGPHKYYILDARIPTGHSAVPSEIVPSYARWSTHRAKAVQARVNPCPILFFQRDDTGGWSLGVSVERAAEGNVSLLNGFHELDVLKSKTSLKIKFDWSGYAAGSGEKQVRGTKKSPLRNLNRLAKLTAGAVRNFMADGGRATTIEGLGVFNVCDVLLLGVIFIGDGAATPLLAVRNQALTPGREPCTKPQAAVIPPEVGLGPSPTTWL